MDFKRNRLLGIVVGLVVVGGLVFAIVRLTMSKETVKLAPVPYISLQEPFPPLNEPEDNPTTPEKVALGRLLFFDPVLSENNDISCAHCHRPDRGMSDGRTTSIGTSGNPVSRNAPTLWNVGYVRNLFWDGRVQSLEAQIIFPLNNPDEMGVQNVEEMSAELQAIPEYEALFATAFPGEPVGLAQVEKALAAFQRTFISRSSPFDKYRAGDETALTSAQKQGLDLFRSTKARCVECHTFPTFSSESFRVIGVNSSDRGRAGVIENGLEGSFKVPTLRNVTLTAPYMHNGAMATLAEVIDFYSDGGGHTRGVENMDLLIQKLDLSQQERTDLVVFLMALTDESNRPEIPDSVPSGLPVVTPLPVPIEQE